MNTLDNLKNKFYLCLEKILFMAAKHDAVVNELNFKVDKLIKLYISSLEQKKDLENKIRALEAELADAKSENKNLNNQLKTTRVAGAISGGDGSHEAKLRINQLVREIEKCIALLNN